MERAVMIQKVKMLVDESASDELIAFYLDMMRQRILNYCHRKDMPIELEYILIDMVAAYFNLRLNPKMVHDESGRGEVKAVTRGDTKIEYGASSTQSERQMMNQSIREFVGNYERQLNAFRKLVSR